ncbi:YrdB family protein [bacterium]|nr:YrdB family protein [bacterium]
MGSHPINLGLRFILELTALIASGMWAWRITANWPKYLLVIAVPLLLTVFWGVFNVPGDPSRSGNAPIVVPGLLRMAIELAVFGFGTWCLHQMGYSKFALAFGLITLAHYIVSYDRIQWLIAQ